MYKLLIFICGIITILWLRMKLTTSFWNRQPVFHIHDIQYWIYPNGVIKEYLGDKNTDVDLEHVETLDILKCSDTILRDVALFIGTHFIESDEIKYSPHITDISNILHEEHPNMSYVSVYRNESGICSTITSTRYELLIDGLTKPIHYVDNLCVRNDMRNQSIAPKSISSLIHNVCIHPDAPNIFLFKREEVLTSIVPLTVFNIYSFVIEDIKCITLSRCTYELIHIDNVTSVMSFFDRYINPSMDVVALPPQNKLSWLIKNNIYMLYRFNDVCGKMNGISIFKKTSLEYNGKSTIECVFTFNDKMQRNDFIGVFFDVISELKPTYDYITIDAIGDNVDIIDEFDRYSNDKCISGYFLYNYASYTKSPRKCAIIC